MKTRTLTIPNTILYPVAILCALCPGVLIFNSELYHWFVIQFLEYAPSRYVMGNNIHEYNSSFNLVLSSVMYSLLGVVLWVKLRHESGSASGGTGVFFRSSWAPAQVLIACLPALMLYVICSTLESRYGEGPHVQWFYWPFIVVAFSNSVRVYLANNPVISNARLGMLVALPSAFLIFPHWSTLVLQFIVGVGMIAEVMVFLAHVPSPRLASIEEH